MNVLLILNNENVTNLRVLVSITEKGLKEKVITLLEEDRGKEAFALLRARAEVKAYLPEGSKPSVRPEMVLIEDML